MSSLKFVKQLQEFYPSAGGRLSQIAIPQLLECEKSASEFASMQIKMIREHLPSLENSLDEHARKFDVKNVKIQPVLTLSCSNSSKLEKIF